MGYGWPIFHPLEASPEVYSPHVVIQYLELPTDLTWVYFAYFALTHSNFFSKNHFYNEP